MSDDSITIPPEHRHRRRDTDRVNPKRVTIGTLLMALPAYPAVQAGIDFHEQWVKRSAQIETLEENNERLSKENESFKALLDDANDRLVLLERWQCRLGWDPPRTRDPQKECR